MRFASKCALPVAMTSALVASCGTAPEEHDDVASSNASITIDTTAKYALVEVQSNKCVDVVGASTASLANLEIATCTGATHQQWTATSMGNGYYRLQNVNSGLCIDVTGASTVAGTKLIQYACGTQTNQQWSFTDVATGVEEIISHSSGQVMDVTGQATADGTLLDQWPWNGQQNQQFELQISGSTTPPTPPSLLSQTGLFQSVAAGGTLVLEPGVQEYQPLYPLWADGASKTRWIICRPGPRSTRPTKITGPSRWGRSSGKSSRSMANGSRRGFFGSMGLGQTTIYP